MARIARHATVAAIIVLALGVATLAQSVQLRHKYRQGERLRYDVTLKGNGTITSPTLARADPFDMSGSLAYVRDTQSVDTSGNATIHTSVQDSSINARWGSDPLPVTLDLPPITAKVTPTGKILSCRVAGPTTQQLPGLGLSGAGSAAQAFDFSKFFGTTQNLGFPVGAVSTGSEWTDAVAITTAEGARLTITSTSKLLGFARYHGRQCAKIHTTFKAPISMQMTQLGIPFELSGSEEGTMTTYFSPTEGRLIASIGKVTGELTMSGSVDIGTGRQQLVAVGMQSQTDVRVELAESGSASRRTGTSVR